MFILECIVVSVVALVVVQGVHPLPQRGAETLKNGNRCSLFQREKGEEKRTGRKKKKKKRFTASNDSIQQ